MMINRAFRSRIKKWTFGGRKKIFKLDLTKATFTPGMAKRNGGGPFAAGVMVQNSRNGSGVPDAISNSLGSAIKNYFYPTFDSYQGTFVVWITPEWNGNDFTYHHIFRNTNLIIYHHSNNQLYVHVGDGNQGIDSSSWVAGNTYCVVIRWDTKNKLDGTNRLCISVNDVHTFLMGNAPTVSAIGTTQYIGSNNGGASACNSIIEGLTIYRRVLFDGTYGQDIGNGDELALVYAAGAGKDPTEITGSWDVVFCLPTNSAVGALATGAGNAWSHPHGSNLLTNGWLDDVTGWADEGTPVTPKSVAFNGTTTQLNQPNHASIQDLHDAAFTAEGWFNASNVTANIAGLMGKTEYNAKGWWLRVFDNGLLQGVIKCATTAAATSIATTIRKDGLWHHIAMTWDDAGDRKIRVYIDGIYAGISGVGVGAVVSDAADNFSIGGVSGVLYSGAVGWIRISNNIRYTANFIPPSRISPPANDANTVRLFKMDEGSGTTITDSSSNAQNATLSNGSWNTSAAMAIDSPGARTFNWGIVLGSDAADEGKKQTLAGLTPGSDYVIRALVYAKGGVAQPRIVIWDETNGAEISHLDGEWSRERVANGGFDSDTLWNKETGWGISGGKINCDGSQTTWSYISQSSVNQLNGGLRVGKLFKVIYTVSGYSAGSVGVRVGSTGYGNSSAVDGTFTEIIRCSGDTLLLFAANADFIGSIDNVSVTPISEESKPEPLIFSFELPTVARAGVAADCVSMSVKLVNAASGGVVGWNQVELLANLLDNPSFQTGAVADPFIPDGWTNNNLDAGDSETESSVIHSVGNSIQFNIGASDEGIFRQINLTIGRFYALGGFYRGNADRGLYFGSYLTSHMIAQSNTTIPSFLFSDPNYWVHHGAIFKSILLNPYFPNLGARTSASGLRYADDMYAFALDDVSLTATPATLANSTESGGIRVDGLDILTATITKFKALVGDAQFRLIPRHSAADVAKFGEATPVVLTLYKDATHYIVVDWSAANTLRLRFNTGAGEQSATWNATGAIVAGSTYTFRVSYNTLGVTLYINGISRIAVAYAIDWGANFPTTAYFGSDNASGKQLDAVFLT